MLYIEVTVYFIISKEKCVSITKIKFYMFGKNILSQ